MIRILEKFNGSFKMVKQELVDAYERLITRRELHEKATRRGNSISGLGAVILFGSAIPIIPAILGVFLEIDFLHSYIGGMLFGLLLMVSGQIINRKVSAPPSLSVNEKEFLKAFEVLKNLDTYFKNGIEFSKIEASKNLSKVERDMTEPSNGSRVLWNALTRDVNENLRLLKRNLKERLLPSISQGKQDEIKKAYSITEKIAEYLLNPTVSELKDLNESMSELRSYVEEKPPLVPFFERHPKLRHASVELIFGVVGFAVYYIGIEFLNISTDTAYIAGTAVFGTLTAGYMAIVGRKH